jgi:hypothetical protein
MSHLSMSGSEAEMLPSTGFDPSGSLPVSSQHPSIFGGFYPLNASSSLMPLAPCSIDTTITFFVFTHCHSEGISSQFLGTTLLNEGGEAEDEAWNGAKYGYG